MPQIRSKKIDTTFMVLVAALTLFGLIILISASSPLGFEKFDDSYYYIKHQILLGLIPGIGALLLTTFTPYQLYKKWAFPMLLISLGLLILVFIPGIGRDYGTFANSWVAIGPLSFQPSELVKLTYLFYLAAWVEKRQEHLDDVYAGFIPFVAILITVSVLMMMQPDLGTLIVIAFMSFVVYFVAGGPLLYLGGLGVLGAAALGIMVKSSEYRVERFMTFLHPELDPQGVGYQINQALLAIGSGGLFGRGYGYSRQKFQYLPEVVGDSIFAVLSEELGFIFTSFFVLTFVAMLLRGIKIAENAKDNFGKFLVIGIIAWLGIQAFINIGAMVGVLPITGVPLPFLSYGGTSLVVSMAAIGVILNVSRASAKG